MVEIEAILNSRPMTPMSSDPSDLGALTPGHFLVGEPLTAPVDPHAQPVKGNLLYRWKLVANLKREFWERWTREYLSELQHRYKWNQVMNNVEPGMMVILKEDNLPVLSWPLGRIVETIKGKDGIVRVANIKTSSGILKRPIQKLAPLPLQEDKVENLSPFDTCATGHKRPAEDEVNVNNKNESSTGQNKRKRSTSAIGLLLMTCLIMPALSKAQVNIEPFKTNPGLFFERIGTAHLIADNWNLVVFFNMSTFWAEFENIKHGTQQLQEICSKMKNQQLCSLTTAQFSNVMFDIRNKNQFFNPPKNQRIRRSPLDIIGNVANSLFGVLDSAYADKMAKIIENLENNQQHQTELLRNQTCIIDSTVNIVKKSEEAIQNQFKTYINETSKMVNAVRQELQEDRLLEIFNALSTRLILAISHYQQTTSALLNIAIDTHQSKINPLVLTPDQLQPQLAVIKEHLPSTLQLPMISGHLTELYRLMSVEGHLTTKQFIFRIKIPLLKTETFELLKLTPVPTLINNTFIMIEPSTRYLLTNLHRDSYYPLSERELEKCTATNANIYFCAQNHPLYRQGSRQAECEISILTQTQIPTRCKLLNVDEVPRWTQLHQSNRWIYVFKIPTIINICCTREIIQRTLTGIGILSLTKGCIIRDKSTTIHSHDTYASSISSSITLSTNFTDLLHPSTVDDLNFKPISHVTLAKNITELQQRISDLKNNEVLVERGQTFDIHHFSLGYTTLIICIIIIVVFIYKYKNHKTHSPTLPAAPNRQQGEFEFKSMVLNS